MRKLIISFGGVLHIKGVGHVGPTWAEPPGGVTGGDGPTRRCRRTAASRPPLIAKR
jgi:hypothetical protein